MRRASDAIRAIAAIACAAMLLGTAAQPTPAAPAPAVRAAGMPALSAIVAGAATATPLTPTVVAPRLAFTDDRDQVVAMAIDSDQGPQPVASGPRHAGEASANGDGDVVAFVSTVDDRNGEVYLRTPAVGSEGTTTRVTCDSATETHPVISPDGGRVAYASNQSGRFQIWVAWVHSGPSPTGSAPPCSQLVRTQVTSSAGESLWPAWADDDTLLFSSTRNDPLGDLFRVPIGTAGEPVPDSAAVRLTDSPAAETQPTTVRLPDGYVDESPAEFTAVVFTTTDYRPDGSLAWLRLPDPGDSSVPEVSSVWPSESVPQSSEADFGSKNDDSGYGQVSLAFATTDRDPFGDVRRVYVDTGDGAWGRLQVLPATVTDVAARPGTAESHPAWARRDYTTFVLVTERLLAADVADVLASDGSGRRVIADDSITDGEVDRPRDESTPTYSPDGLRIAYSRSTARGREIVTADADGADIRPLVRSRSDDSYDVEPSWSPDGTQIAFVRSPVDPSVEYLSAPRIWVATVATGTARRVSADGTDVDYWDENPSWSPDGRRLVIARTVVPLPPDLSVSLLAPTTATTDVPFTVTAVVRDVGRGSTRGEQAVVRVSAFVDEGPVPVTFSTVDPRCSADGTGGLVCRAGPLAAGEAASLALTAMPRFAGTGDLRATVDHLDEPDFTNNSDSAGIEITDPPPDLVAAVVAPPSLRVDESGDVTVTVSNVGGSRADVVNVNIVASAGPTGGQVEFSDGTGIADGCTQVAQFRVTCAERAGLPTAGHLTWALHVRGVQAGNGARVTVSVANADGEVVDSNNTATATIDVSDNCCVIPRRTPSPTASPSSGSGGGGPVVVAPGVVPRGLFAPHVRTAGAMPRSVTTRAGRPTEVRAVPTSPPDGIPSHLWVIDVVTGRGQQVTVPAPGCPPTRVCRPTPLVGRVPAWSPDGLRIAYETQGAVRIAHLRDADHNGRPDAPEAATTVDAVTGFTTAGAPTRNRPALSAATDPAWSPDGTELAIAGQPAGQPDQQGIYALHPDGTGLRVIAQDREPETEPAWQPYADLAVTLLATPASVGQGGGTVLEATVTNHGPARAATVRLQVELPTGLTPGLAPAGCTLAGALMTCALGTLAPGAGQGRSLPATAPAFGAYVVTAVADSPTPDSVPTNNEATATVTVVEPVADLAVTVSTTSPGYVGGSATATFTVRNNKPSAATGATLTVAYPADLVSVAAPEPCLTGAQPCALDPLAPGAETALVTTLTFLTGGTGAVTATISGPLRDPDLANNVASTPLVVKVPALTLMPEVVTPGGVTLASGTDFPPGAKVVLAWDVGLTERVPPVTVGPDGTITPVQVLVFRRDQLGIRDLTATGSVPGVFAPVASPLLVAPQRVSPPDFVVRN